MTLYGRTIPSQIIIILRTQHHTSILAGILHQWKNLRYQHICRNISTACSTRCSRETQEEPCCSHIASPCIPCCFQFSSISFVFTVIVIELHPNIIKEATGQGLPHVYIRKGTLGCCSQTQLLCKAVASQVAVTIKR